MDNQVIINNLLVSYSESGNGAMALLFLHGWRSNKEVWVQVIKNLSIINNQLSIIAIDLPGFGSSQMPSEPMTVGDYAEVVKGLIEKLELKNVILVGHSFGGRVGIKLASQNPNLISKLVLVDSAGFAMDSGKKSAIALVAKIAKPFFKPKIMQGLRKGIYKAIGAEDYLATPELQKTFVNIVSEDLTEDMRRISVPTLIVWGNADKETPVEFLYKMKSLIPNTKYQILSNAGHFSFLDNPEEFAQALLAFFSPRH